ncbi:hypothetical protein N750_09540 [Legionella pneumophila str. Leg01/53]|nr:hypothetical protein N750_09540 [Legionella pneumophila str. Leg01/53]
MGTIEELRKQIEQTDADIIEKLLNAKSWPSKSVL